MQIQQGEVKSGIQDDQHLGMRCNLINLTLSKRELNDNPLDHRVQESPIRWYNLLWCDDTTKSYQEIDSKTNKVLYHHDTRHMHNNCTMYTILGISHLLAIRLHFQDGRVISKVQNARIPIPSEKLSQLFLRFHSNERTFEARFLAIPVDMAEMRQPGLWPDPVAPTMHSHESSIVSIPITV